eukprot:gb/GFBE01073283.1/.p1 GENE.gb/GFBE01073283.1/~~gb/GFBE01073283.1/.p1  ORF type:complete len:203 (+),score=12.42 gb/GFBE01073283.1/:1-609(+)
MRLDNMTREIGEAGFEDFTIIALKNVHRVTSSRSGRIAGLAKAYYNIGSGLDGLKDKVYDLLKTPGSIQHRTDDAGAPISLEDVMGGAMDGAGWRSETMARCLASQLGVAPDRAQQMLRDSAEQQEIRARVTQALAAEVDRQGEGQIQAMAHAQQPDLGEAETLRGALIGGLLGGQVELCSSLDWWLQRSRPGQFLFLVQEA